LIKKKKKKKNKKEIIMLDNYNLFDTISLGKKIYGLMMSTEDEETLYIARIKKNNDRGTETHTFFNISEECEFNKISSIVAKKHFTYYGKPRKF
jgi:hypothetical protein